jgi:RNA polymerase sigma-70 factor, ECF subfamily
VGQDPDQRIEGAVAEHGERLFRAARYLLGNEQEAEDLCQATFLELCRSIDRFEGRASLYTWLYRILLNLYYRRLRRRRLERQAQADVVTAESWDPPEPRADAEHRDGRLREAILALPRIYQTVIVLHYLESRSAVEIGAILALPAGTVRSRLHEARTLLRRRLQKEFPDGL